MIRDLKTIHAEARKVFTKRDKLEADPVRPRHLVTDTGVGYRLLAGE